MIWIASCSWIGASGSVEVSALSKSDARDEIRKLFREQGIRSVEIEYLISTEETR